MTRRSLAWNSALALAMAAFSLFIASQFGPSMSRWNGNTNDTSRSDKPASRDWHLIVDPHLKSCHQRVLASSNGHLEPIVDLLNRARNRTPEFAKVALGFSSKWRLVADYVPFTKGDRNETFLKSEFEERVLRGSDLERDLTQSIESFLREMRSLEGEMLVAIRADLEDFPEIDWSTWKNDDLLREKFESAIQTAMISSDKDFQNAISSQLVSVIAGEVLTQVAVRMGVSGGILGAGAASSWATFGIGIVVGVIIDQIVSNVWAYMADPEREMVVQIQKQLDTLQRLICDGDENTMGLRQHFLKVANDRLELRELAIKELLSSAASSESAKK